MKRLIVIVVLAVAAGGAWWWWDRERPAHNAHVYYGNVDIREVHLGFRVAGRIRSVGKNQGDAVAPGEVLAQLDDEPYRQAAAQAEAAAAQARARWEELRNGARPEELAQARASLAAAEAALTLARLSAERQASLFAQGVIPPQENDAAQAALREATARREAAAAALALLEAGARAEQIAQASAAMQAAEAAAAAARLQVDDTVLTAPEPGIVLTRAVEPGAMVSAGATVLTVSLAEPTWIRAYAPETDLGELRPGRAVLVQTDSRAEPYRGRIGDVSPRAEFTPRQVETTALRTSLVYRFRVLVDEPDDRLRQGMPVTVRLAPEER